VRVRLGTHEDPRAFDRRPAMSCTTSFAAGNITMSLSIGTGQQPETPTTHMASARLRAADGRVARW
jgi:hypothetical protein